MNNHVVDIIAFGAHPDDVECAAAGTLLVAKNNGAKIILVDITRGELGSFGTVDQRTEEAKKTAMMLGVKKRIQLNFIDGQIANNRASQIKIIELIRLYRPKIILANAFIDRHPDHNNAANLIKGASFFSGLKNIETHYKGVKQLPYRPAAVYHYIQDLMIKPDVVIDISDVFSEKMKVIVAYTSQFKDSQDSTPGGIKNLLKQIENSNQIFGRNVNVAFAEGFTKSTYIAAKDIQDLI